MRDVSTRPKALLYGAACVLLLTGCSRTEPQPAPIAPSTTAVSALAAAPSSSVGAPGTTAAPSELGATTVPPSASAPVPSATAEVRIDGRPWDPAPGVALAPRDAQRSDRPPGPRAPSQPPACRACDFARVEDLFTMAARRTTSLAIVCPARTMPCSDWG